MNIVQINAVGQTMSTGRTCKELQDYINQSTEHTCYTFFAQGIEDVHSFQVGNSLEWKVHGLLSRLTGRQGYFSHFGTKKMLDEIEFLKTSLLVFRNLHGNYANFRMIFGYAAQKNIPCVLILHDCFFFTGKCTHYTLDQCYKWKTGCGDCPRLKKDNPSWGIDATAEMWQNKKKWFEAIPHLAVIGVSDWIAGEARKSFLSCAQEITRIYNWIDMNTFSPKEDIEKLRVRLNVMGKKVILGVASGWASGKGLESFIKLRSLFGSEYIIVLVGKMEGGVILPNGIISVPPTDSAQELAEYYSMADVFVTMSLEESFGKVSAEALACGTPVVCFDSTANKELVGDGCGAVVQPNDMYQMKIEIEHICSIERKTFQEPCREFALNNFDKNTLIRDYIELFERTISGNQ